MQTINVKTSVKSLKQKECECRAYLESLIFDIFNTATGNIKDINPLAILLLIKELNEDLYNTLNNLYKQINSNDILYDTISNLASSITVGDALLNILQFIASDQNTYLLFQTYIKLARINAYSTILKDRLSELEEIIEKLKENKLEEQRRKKTLSKANLIIKKVNSLLVELQNSNSLESFYSTLNKILTYIQIHKNFICHANDYDKIPRLDLILRIEVLLVDIRNVLPNLINYINSLQPLKLNFGQNILKNTFTNLFLTLNKNLISYAIDILNNKSIPSYCVKLTLIINLLKILNLPLNLSKTQIGLGNLKPIEICEQQLAQLAQISQTANQLYQRYLSAKNNGLIITPDLIRREVARLNKIIKSIKKISANDIKLETISKIERSVKLKSTSYIRYIKNKISRINQLSLLGFNSLIFLIPCVLLAIALYESLFELANSVGKFISDAIERLVTKPYEELIAELKKKNLIPIITGIINVAECYNVQIANLKVPKELLDKVSKFTVNGVSSLYSKLNLLNFKISNNILSRIGINLEYIRKIILFINKVKEIQAVARQIKNIDPC